jgi:hypothetical protein
MRRSFLKRQGTSETALLKKEIQRLLREIVIKRDGGCILRKYRRCNDEVLQADHLITRANSGTYADTRLVVCVCRSCHYWKSVGSNRNKNQYDDMVKNILPKELVELWERAERDSWRPTRYTASDWKLEILNLKSELEEL